MPRWNQAQGTQGMCESAICLVSLKVSFSPYGVLVPRHCFSLACSVVVYKTINTL